MEIKTEHVFKMEDIIAVLVPQDLWQSLRTELHQWFPEKIIPVPFTKDMKTLFKLPEILGELHKEAITPESIEFTVPNYEGILHQIVKQHTQFAVHAVRLHTLFDFNLKYIDNMTQSANLLKEAEAGILIEYPNGSGWVAIHQRKTFQLKISQELEKLLTMSSRFDNTKIITGLSSAKGPQKKMLRCIPTEQDLAQLKDIKQGLSSLSDVSAIYVDYKEKELGIPGSRVILMLSFPTAQQTMVSNLQTVANMGRALEVKETKEKAEAQKLAQQTKAAVFMQKNCRRALVRKDFCAYYQLHKETQALLANHKLEDALTGISHLGKIRDKLYSRIK